MTDEKHQQLRDSLLWRGHEIAKSLLLKDEYLEFHRTCCRTQRYSSPRFIEWLIQHYPDRLYWAATALGLEV